MNEPRLGTDDHWGRYKLFLGEGFKLIKLVETDYFSDKMKLFRFYEVQDVESFAGQAKKIVVFEDLKIKETEWDEFMCTYRNNEILRKAIDEQLKDCSQVRDKIDSWLVAHGI